MSKTESYATALRDAFSGDAWHGPPIESLLDGVDAERAFARPQLGAHSIWELVLHMTYWRRAAIDALTGGSIAAYQPNTPEDWVRPETADEEAWNGALTALRSSQAELLRSVEALDDEDLDRIVEGRDYKYEVIVLGILQHDLYHAGQIALLRK